MDWSCWNDNILIDWIKGDDEMIHRRPVSDLRNKFPEIENLVVILLKMEMAP